MIQTYPNGYNRVKVLISIGSNASADISDVAETVLKCSKNLSEAFHDQISFSRLYRTPAFPRGAGPDFVNAACTVTCEIDAGAVLHRLHDIEAAFGRTRTARWGQRILDLDLLAVGDQVLPGLDTWQHWRDLPLAAQMKNTPDQLILPHPRIQDRSFVLVPLADVAPDWIHPVSRQSVRQMLDQLDPDDIASVLPLP